VREARQYQAAAEQAVFAALVRRVIRQMVVMATGTGKTTVAVNVTKAFKRILWVAHSEILIEQSALAFIRERFDEALAKHIGAKF